MYVYGELKKADLENLGSDLTPGCIGRIYWNTATLKAMIDDGTHVYALLRNDSNLTIGNNGTASNNVRLNRAAAALLQFVTGDDVTAEGSQSTSLAQISAKMEGYANSGLPAAGQPGRIAWITDLKTFKGDNGANWVNLTPTNAGVINYLSANPDAEFNTAGWVRYADAAGNKPVDGIGGSPSSTWTRSTSTPLRGTASFLWTKAGSANRQGEGVSFDYTIDVADQAKCMVVSCDYSIASGIFTAADGITPPLNDGTTSINSGMSDLEFFMYDVTNAVLIPITPQVLTANGAGSFQFKGICQTNSNSVSYRLIIHTAKTTTNNFTVKFDNFFVGPQAITAGSPDTEAVAYTPIFVGFGTVINISAYSRRDGDMLEIWGSASSGTTTGVPATISLGYNGVNGTVTPDSNKLSAITSIVGEITFNAIGTNGVPQFAPLAIFAGASVLSVVNVSTGSTNNLTAVNANALMSGNDFSWKARIPIQGWSSTVQMSNDTDTRVVAMNAHLSGGNHTSSGSFQAINGTWVTDSDTHGAFLAGNTGEYHVPVSGWYSVNGAVDFAPSATGTRGVLVYKNGSVIIPGGFVNAIAGGTQDNLVPFSGSFTCVAGDIITILAYHNSGGSLNYGTGVGGTTLTIHRLSGPASIASTETVSAKYTNSAGTAFNSVATMVFPTKVWDTHGAFDASTGIFKVPVSGKYRMSATIANTGVSMSTSQYTFLAAANLTQGTVTQGPFTYGNGTSQNYMASISTLVDAVAGDEISIKAASAVSTTLLTDATYNHIAIERIGN